MNWSYWDIAHLQWGWKLLQTGRSLVSSELQRAAAAAAAATLHQPERTSLGSDKFTTEAFFSGVKAPWRPEERAASRKSRSDERTLGPL